MNAEVVDVEPFRVSSAPATAFYVPDFISEAEERFLLTKIRETPKFRWTQLSNRRLQNWGGVPHPKGMIQEDLPPWLQRVVDKLNELSIFTGHLANHVLLNEYQPGQGIMPHLDGDLFYPTISTLSLHSHTVLNFYRPVEDRLVATSPTEDRLLCRFFLEPRSLLILKDDLYTKYLHGIEAKVSDDMTTGLPFLNIGDERFFGVETDMPRGTRISLTIRNVPKTSKLKLKLGK